MKNKQDYSYEHEVNGPNGEIRWQHWTDRPLLNAAGEVVELQSVGRDITEKKWAEEALKAYSERLAEMVEARTRELQFTQERLVRQEKLAVIGQMSGSIAHELRNPLGAIKQSSFYLQRLHDRGELNHANPRVNEHFELIKSEINTVDRVINGMLEITRLKPPRQEAVDLNQVILEAAERSRLQDHIQLRLELECNLFMIWADPLQLRHVFINVLTNASQACTENGQVTISVRSLSDLNQVQIQIQDNGRGVEPESVTKVFEPLFTTKAKGTGLGLSICKQIIETHGGSITLSSRVNQGTIVQILLPHPQKKLACSTTP